MPCDRSFIVFCSSLLTEHINTSPTIKTPHVLLQQSSARQLQSVFVFVSRLPDTQRCTDRTFIFGSRKESLHMVAELKTPTVSHDGPDAVPRSDAAGTGASATDHGAIAANAAADATDAGA